MGFPSDIKTWHSLSVKLGKDSEQSIAAAVAAGKRDGRILVTAEDRTLTIHHPGEAGSGYQVSEEFCRDLLPQYKTIRGILTANKASLISKLIGVLESDDANKTVTGVNDRIAAYDANINAMDAYDQQCDAIKPAPKSIHCENDDSLPAHGFGYDKTHDIFPDTLEVSYSSNNQTLSFQFNNLGWDGTEELENGGKYEFQYDGNGKLTTAKGFSAGRFVEILDEILKREPSSAYTRHLQSVRDLAHDLSALVAPVEDPGSIRIDSNPVDAGVVTPSATATAAPDAGDIADAGEPDASNSDAFYPDAEEAPNSLSGNYTDNPPPATSTASAAAPAADQAAALPPPIAPRTAVNDAEPFKLELAPVDNKSKVKPNDKNEARVPNAASRRAAPVSAVDGIRTAVNQQIKNVAVQKVVSKAGYTGSVNITFVVKADGYLDFSNPILKGTPALSAELTSYLRSQIKAIKMPSAKAAGPITIPVKLSADALQTYDLK